MSLTRWNPWDELVRLREEMSRFLDNTPLPSLWRGEGWQPSLDVYEQGNEIVVKADLPGLDPKDVEVRVFPDLVTLRGESRQEEAVERPGYYHRERRYGSFFRQVRLPARVIAEDAKATFKNGVLEVRIPKAEKEEDRGFKVDIQQG